MNQKRAENASALIITAFEKGVSGFSLNQEPLDEVGDGWGAYDLGLQNQNLLLRAREMGLDTPPSQDMRRALEQWEKMQNEKHNSE